MSFVPEYQKVVKLAASRYKQVLASFPLPSCNVFPLGPSLLFYEFNHCEILLKTMGAEEIERNEKREEEKDKHAFMSPLTAFEAHSPPHNGKRREFIESLALNSFFFFSSSNNALFCHLNSYRS